MKTFKAICAATLLALSLSISGYADTTPGDVHTPGVPVPAGDSTSDPTLSGDTTGDDTIGDISFSAVSDLIWAMTSIF